MARESNKRIVQIMPMAGPLWAVFVQDVPVDGYHYWLERVHGLALVESWPDNGPFESDDRVPDRERFIHPIYVEDGSYFDADCYGSSEEGDHGSFVMTYIDEKPVTRDEKLSLEARAVERLDERRRRVENFKKAKADRDAEKAGA